ncbi:Fic family protein [Corynebacterium sp.]|uniref:Fic family protein n=1 Tax=Corynebacterium sp. TaxID=1720 RepID=UPI0026DD7C1C|nr:Fic family protein [Corynebacterium sp.]MDO5031294.1 Fic family protein [Corynebacterium sp.]
MAASNGNTQSDEEKAASLLIEIACMLNKKCGRRKRPDGSWEEYSGFSVDMEGLESAIFAPFQVIWEQPRFPSVYDRAAAVIVNIARGHHFEDGNKRTALHTGLTYLRACSIIVRPPSHEAGAQLVIDCVLQENYETAIAVMSTKLQQWTAG